MQDNPHLKDMSLISSIRFTTPTLETPVNKLNFRAGGRLNGAERRLCENGLIYIILLKLSN